MEHGMSSRQQQIAPEQAIQQAPSTSNPTSVETSAQKEAVQGQLIESLFS